MEIRSIGYIAIGGFIGSILRYWIGEWLIVKGGFPLGTLIVNLLGCLLLGWFLSDQWVQQKLSTYIRLGVATGFLGAFTTFSTFSVETLLFIERHEFGMAIVYVLLSIGLGLSATLFGIKLARRPMRTERGEGA
jgi:CrcB protein